MCNKNFLAKFFVAIIFLLGIFNAGTVHAEVKNYLASDTAIFNFGADDEKIISTVKNIAKLRGEKVAKEKIFADIKNANKNLSADDISAVINNFVEIVDVAYEKFSISAGAFETDGAENSMYEATITANFDTEKIAEYIALATQDKANIIQQNKILQQSATDIDKIFDDLSANAENLTAEEIKIEVEKIDKKISAQEKLIEGNKIYFQKDFQGAISKYTEAIRLDENNSPAYTCRGFVQKNLKNYQDATEDFEKAVEVDSNNVQAYYLLGQCCDILKNYQGAIENFTKAVELDDKNVAAYQERGNIYYRLQDYSAATEDFSKIIQLTPNNAKIYLRRGLSLKNSGNDDSAVEDFTKAIALNPNYVYAYLNRGLSLKNLENYEAAIKDFSSAIKLDLNYAQAYYNRGKCYQALGNIQQAEKDFAKAESLGYNV